MKTKLSFFYYNCEKFGSDRFSRFNVFWIQTNKQTDKQSIYIDKNKITLDF